MERTNGAGDTTVRLWSIHPKYLDPAGLVALWREALLAKKVLLGKTRGYRHHPQLERFRLQERPVAAINQYLDGIWSEASRRGYSFDRRKIGPILNIPKIPITSGQLGFELRHLRGKLRKRNSEFFRTMAPLEKLTPHPLFRIRKGPVEPWERG